MVKVPVFLSYFFFLIIPPPPRSTLFPYTTLFRSGRAPGQVPAFDRQHPGDGWPSLPADGHDPRRADRKSTRLNSSLSSISYAVFCLKKKINLALSTNSELYTNHIIFMTYILFFTL